MERQQCNSLQNFDESKSEILKKRLLKSNNAAACSNLAVTGSQHNVLLNTLRAPISSSMIVTSVSGGQGGLQHGLVAHSLAPVKLHSSPATYPLQLSTVHVPVQIPGTSSNINVPVQLSGPTSSMPLQITPVSLPIQVSGTTSVPVQLPAGETINVPLQIPGNSQNIQYGGSALPSMPILQTTNQPLNSIIHLHMGSNHRSNMDGTTEMTATSSSHQLNNISSVSQVQMGNNSTVVQIPSSSNNSIQITLPNSVSSGTVQLRGTARSMPHVVYIQTPTGLKPVTSTEVISQASTSGNPPQIIVRRPVTSNNIHLISSVSSKPNIAPKLPGHAKGSILAPAATPPIVIQKPKTTEKMIVPVSIAPGNTGKQTIAYLGSVKKPNSKNFADNQSILISNNQSNVHSNNQKVFLTPMNMPKIQNTKFILPVTLPATMASKGPIINLQIANGQIQNDHQGNITVMRDSGQLESADMPPLQPLGKMINMNGKESNSVPQSPNKNESFAISIPGSRAEPTGEQGEYTLSIPETNAAMNDDIYTVSIADEEGGQSREKSFTLAIPEKGKSLLNRNLIDRNDLNCHHVTIAAPAILRRSNSDNSERKISNANLKRRISLCNDNLSSKISKQSQAIPQKISEECETQDSDNNDDHRVPSLFCDEKLDKDLDCKVILGDSDDDYKDELKDKSASSQSLLYHKKNDFGKQDYRMKRESVDSALEDDPPGLLWRNGVAQLQGSGLQFHTNEFGLIDVVDASDVDEPLTNAKYHTPLKHRVERARDKKPTSPEDLYRCDSCGCHGMAADFITPNFCSVTCQTEVQKMTQKKRDRERAEITRRRNKMKKLLIRKHLTDPDSMRDQDDHPSGKHGELAGEMPEAMLKMTEDLIENEKYPWMCGKNGFSWMRYLDFCKAKAAPVKLFKDPFPYNTRHGFKVGMRMEAIDPQHASLFCVVSVAEVQGFRMRLHFDEYDDVHDYWVNADCIDIFPSGWCERNGRALRPPRGHSASSFSWPLYLKHMRAIAAPRHLFPHITTTTVKPNAFRIGMKLEAEDRNNDMVCAATVADMLDSRLLISFDSWDAMYDIWLDPSSPYIHPVGWAEENDVSITPPNYYKEPESFSWEAYLAETGAAAAPPRAFKTRAPSGFKPGMKLEAVDKRVPFLIRVATVSAVKGHQVRVSFDGWPDALAYWLDDDSPDIHPVGWCLKTGHPLEPPLTEEEVAQLGPCGVGGCRGLGSLRGGAHKQHVAASACPYRAPASPAPPDRLAPPPSRYSPSVSTTVAQLGPCGVGGCRGLGSLRGGAHKQHVAASACPYRAPASPAPPDRLAPPPSRYSPSVSTTVAQLGPCGVGGCRGLGSLRGGAHKQHVAASACPYRAPASPAPPDRLAPPPSRYSPSVSTTVAQLGPCGVGGCRGLGSLRGGAHKQHVAASACPYRAPASPAPPDRLAPPPSRYSPSVSTTVAQLGPCGVGGCRGLGSLRGGAHKQHVAASACPYRAPASPAPPDRLAPPPSRYSPSVSTTVAQLGPCGVGGCRGLGSLRGGAHKQHVAASACPYRAPASPAPPDRLAPPPSRYSPSVSTTVAQLGPCGVGGCRGLGSLRGGAHKQHVAASACPYRAPASPAPPDRLAPPPSRYSPSVSTTVAQLGPCGVGGCRGLGSLRGGAHKQHVAASACPYRAPASPAPPDRLAPPPSRYSPSVSTTVAQLGPCGVGGCRGLGSLRGGAHKQHVAASACPYRAPASPAPPDRLAPPPSRYSPSVSTTVAQLGPCGVGGCRGLGSLRGGAHKQHVAASACPYRAPASPAPPDRLAPPPSRYSPSVSTTVAQLGPCGVGGCRGLGSLRGGAHKQHVAASACPYRAPASPAPPDRLAPPPSRYSPSVSTTVAQLGPCGVGGCRGLGSLRGGAHKQHVAASACPYRAPASPAPPDRLAPPPSRYSPSVSTTVAQLGPCGVGGCRGLGSLRGGAHKQHVAASACPYRAPASPAPPDRLAPPPSRYSPSVSTTVAQLGPCGVGGCRGLGSLRGGAHKQHVAASACPYRAPASPAPPDRLAPPPSRYSPSVSTTVAQLGPCGVGGCRGLGSLRGGAHKQHVAASACPYRAPASPAPPDRLAPPPSRYSPSVSTTVAQLGPCGVGGCRGLGSLRGGAHKQHVAASACPYRAPASPAPPDRLAPPPSRYSPSVSTTVAQLGPCGVGGCRGLGSLRGGAHKQHVAASACPYRAPASPAPPDRLAPPPSRYSPSVSTTVAQLGPCGVGGCRGLGSLRGGAHKQHVAASACPYRAPASPAPPDRLAPPPSRYSPSVSTTVAQLGPCGVGGCRGLGSLRGGAHKQHVAASACPYRAPASPAPPDRLAPPPSRYSPSVSTTVAQLGPCGVGGCRGLGSLRGGAHKQHVAASACPYRAPASPAPPDRLAPPPSRYSPSVSTTVAQLGPCGVGGCRGLGSLRGGAHKQHVAASACPYRAPASPAPPDRLAPPPSRYSPSVSTTVAQLGPCGVGGCRGLGSLRGGAHKQHVAASACPYRAPASPAPPDRLAPPPSRYSPSVSTTVAQLGPCGVGGCRGLGSLRGGAHKQHVAASACPYRAPASPAPPDRLAPPPSRYSPSVSTTVAQLGPCGVGGCRGLGSLRGGAHKQHVAASACPYRAPASPAPPDRLAPPPSRYSPSVSTTVAQLGPCGVGGCRGLGSLRGGAHKQHVAASACPYRAPASPAPPDRLAPPPSRYSPSVSTTVAQLGPCGVGGCRGLGSLRGGAHKQHVAASACPYRAPASPAPPDRLAPPPSSVLDRPLKPEGTVSPASDAPKEKPARGRPPKHKKVEEASKTDAASEDESVSSSGGGGGGKARWRGRGRGRRAGRARAARALRPDVSKHVAALQLPGPPTDWTMEEVCSLLSLVAGAGAGAAARRARLAGRELLMASCDELVACLRLRLGPAIKVYGAVRQLRRIVS